MSEDNTVISLDSARKKRKETGREITIAVPIPICVDPDNPRYCLTASQENRIRAPGRCPGIAATADNKLICGYFRTEDPTVNFTMEARQRAHLLTPNGAVAHCGTHAPRIALRAMPHRRINTKTRPATGNRALCENHREAPFLFCIRSSRSFISSRSKAADSKSRIFTASFI